MTRFLLAFALLLPLAACDSAGSPDDTADPAPPPASTFRLDGSFPQALAPSGPDALVGQHFVQGAARVGIVSTVIGAWLALPAAVTDAATDADPVVVDGTWIWENTTPINGTTFTFRLEGTPAGTSVDWRMLISADRPVGGHTYDDFVLYTATTSLDGREGTWRLFIYDDAGVRTHVLSADFDVTSATVAEITYSIPASHPDPSIVGSSVRYAADGAERLFDWHQEPEDFDHLVEWNATTHVGSITATNYNAGARACWDARLDDAPCAPALRPAVGG